MSRTLTDGWLRPFAQRCTVVAAALVVAAVANAQSGKRGIGGGSLSQTNALNAEWYYNWGNTPSAEILAGGLNGQYVPMIWSARADTVQTTVDRILGYKDTLNLEYVLGFNEPEREDQANMTVESALSIWDSFDHQFRDAGIKLVSPATGTDGIGYAWLRDFMTQATAQNLVVDAIAVHWYGTPNLSNPTATANGFLNRIDALHAEFGKPIWITEFAGMDWGVDDITSPALQAFNEAFLSVVVPGLESRAHVGRYAWWQYGRRTFPPADQSPGRFEENDTQIIAQDDSRLWTPTGIGDQYVPSYREGEQHDLAGTSPGKHNFYLRGGSLLSSSGPSVTVASIDAINGESDFGGAADWQIDSGLVRVRSGAALRKTGTDTVTINNSLVSNSGEIRVTAGVLSLRNNAQLFGSGSIDLESGATLALGSPSDSSGALVSQAVDLNGGVVHTNPILSGVHTISGAATVMATSTFRGDGTLLVSGPLQAPAGQVGGGIIKEGNGSLVLGGINTFRGELTVKAGTVALGAGGAVAAASGVSVAAGGRFDVSDVAAGFQLASGQTLVNALGGRVEGNLVVGDSSAVRAAGLFSGNVTTQSGGNLSIGEGAEATTRTIRLTPPSGTNGNASDVRVRSGSNGNSLQGDTQALGLGSISSTDAFRSLFTFDLSSSGIADPAFIDSVDLTLTLTSPNGTQVNAASAPVLELLSVGSYNSDAATYNNTVALFDAGSVVATTTGPNFTQYSAGAKVAWTQSSGQFVDAVKDSLGESLHLGAKAAVISGLRSFYFIDSSETTNADAAPTLTITYTEPARPIGASTIDGDLSLAEGSTLGVDLLDTTAFDSLDVNGVATLDGVLSVNAIDTSRLSVNDTFTVLTAASIVNGLTLGGPNGAYFNLSASTPTEIVLTYVGAISLPGDFNGDQVVNAADYTVWRDNFGSPEGTLLRSNGTGGTVDHRDYDLWLTNFGAVTPTAPATASVPEPTAGAIGAALLLAAARHARRRPVAGR